MEREGLAGEDGCGSTFEHTTIIFLCFVVSNAMNFNSLKLSVVIPVE